jgi:hypothetical protein
LSDFHPLRESRPYRRNSNRSPREATRWCQGGTSFPLAPTGVLHELEASLSRTTRSADDIDIRLHRSPCPRAGRGRSSSCLPSSTDQVSFELPSELRRTRERYSSAAVPQYVARTLDRISLFARVDRAWAHSSSNSVAIVFEPRQASPSEAVGTDRERSSPSGVRR